MSSEPDTEASTSIKRKFQPSGRKLRLHEAHFLALPTVVWFLIFLIGPLLVIVAYSFLDHASFNVIYEFTLSSWTDRVFSRTVLRVFGRTILVALFVTALTLMFAYPIAYYLRFHTGPILGIVLLLFLVIPFWTSELIRTLGWFPILGRSGFINWSLLTLGVINEPIRWLIFSTFAQVVGYLQNFLVFMAAPIYISLAQIDQDLLDASFTLRGDPVATFVNVTWPLSLPGVAIGCIFTFVLTVGNFLVPQFLSAGDRTVTMLVFEHVERGLHYPHASAISIALLVVIFSFVYLLIRFVDITDIAQG